MDEPVRLNLGAGNKNLDGFIPLDYKNGHSVYPLKEHEDGTVDEIYASHVLEHFSHLEVAAVVKDWARALKPGGRMRIAVPDFKKITDQYNNGHPINTQGFLMGGHTDEHDFHKALFDRETLAEVMANAGLERLGHFEPVADDCSSLDISLNIQGFKPTSDDAIGNAVLAIMSAPRYGSIMHGRIAYEALYQNRIRFLIGQGVYWSQVLTELMEHLLDIESCEFILTLDYDTIFTRDDVRELYRLMKTYPEYDAICANQMRRARQDGPLFVIGDKDGKAKQRVFAAEFERNVTQVTTGHFGCTMIRCESLRKLPRPWFKAVPDDDGRWGEGKVDADIYFWHGFKQAKMKVGWANRVVVGHLQEMIIWPGREFQPVIQKTTEYQEEGIPKEVMR